MTFLSDVISPCLNYFGRETFKDFVLSKLCLFLLLVLSSSFSWEVLS